MVSYPALHGGGRPTSSSNWKPLERERQRVDAQAERFEPYLRQVMKSGDQEEEDRCMQKVVCPGQRKECTNPTANAT
ncbi:hypothetical protein MTO96_002442 [Rhipicephalus appendiculatus]